MSDLSITFAKEAEIKAFDKEHRQKLRRNISFYDKAVAIGKEQYSNLELAKTRAGYIKNKVVIDLPKHLVDFEANFQSRGGKVLWAQDADEAVKEILKIAKKNHAQSVVKMKSMVTEEIELNEAFRKNDIESRETDLGEFIVQQAGQKPYHIVTPAMHMSKEEVADIFERRFSLAPNSSPETIAAFVRGFLREKFYTADIGVTGGNFLIADIGAVGITENEGNGLMSVSFPKIHIAIVGIEKLIPRLADLDLFWPLLATFGTGQNITAYNSILTGPRQEGETDGPEEMYVILLDNKRTELLIRKNQRRALTCIRCGACLNACPVYKNIGGHTYGCTYSGPIGAIITPFLEDLKDYGHLSYASSLCGACTDVCPVKINLHRQLLYNRNEFVKQKYPRRNERFIFKWYKRVMVKRKWLDFSSSKTKNKIMHKYVAKDWGPRRELPMVAPMSFKQLWQERRLNNPEK